MKQKPAYKGLSDKGFSLVEIIVVIAIMVVLLAVLAPFLLRYVENSRMQKDESAMDEVCHGILLALSDSEIFDEAVSYAIPNNYITYTDSSGVYAAKYVDEEFWAPDGSGYAVTITFNPDENGTYTLANGLVNDMTYGNGSVADARTADGLQQCYFSEMGQQKLYHKVAQTIGETFSEKSATYKNSSYTVFITFDVVNGIKRADVYGEWNGTNLSPDCPASLGSGTSSYVEEEPEQTKTGGTTQSNFTSSDLQGGGGTSGSPFPSYKQCTHENWLPSNTNEEIHICSQCGKEEVHEYETTTNGTLSCDEPSTTIKTCTICGKTETETQEVSHIFDNASDLTCNRCGLTFTAYAFKAQDYDSKMGTTTATDAHVVIPETFEYNGTQYKVTSVGRESFFKDKSLTSLALPASITRIEAYVFCQDTSLKSVDLSKCTELKMIQMYTFYNCASLENIDFSNCTKLTEISDSAFETNSIKNLDFSNCAKLTEIGDSAFASSTSLTNVIFPDNITTIGNAAFYNCPSLRSIDLSNCTKLTTFGYNVFKNCTSLTDVVLHDNITTIDKGTFYGCTALTNVTIPANVRTIGKDAFYNCTSLTDITFQGTTAQWNAISKDANWRLNSGPYNIHCVDGNITE